MYKFVRVLVHVRIALEMLCEAERRLLLLACVAQCADAVHFGHAPTLGNYGLCERLSARLSVCVRLSQNVDPFLTSKDDDDDGDERRNEQKEQAIISRMHASYIHKHASIHALPRFAVAVCVRV